VHLSLRGQRIEVGTEVGGVVVEDELVHVIVGRVVVNNKVGMTTRREMNLSSLCAVDEGAEGRERRRWGGGHDEMRGVKQLTHKWRGVSKQRSRMWRAVERTASRQ
jgi:hypothetical protein